MSSEKTGKSWGTAIKELAMLLTVIFASLRACGVINWTWYWVLSPLFAKWVLCGVLSVFVVWAKQEEWQ